MQPGVALILALVAAGAGGHSVDETSTASIEAARADVARLERRLAVLEAAARARKVTLGRITPTLSPVSDAKFFDGHHADYPTDYRPTVKAHFGVPYPSVQSDADYDSDYTKDENGDNGEWDAQMHYDHLRAEVSKIQGRIDLAQAKEDEEMSELNKAKQDEAAAHADTEADSAKVKELRDAAEKAKQEREKAKAEAAQELAAVTNISEAQALVDKETKELEGCKAELDAAKARLEELLAAQSGNKAQGDAAKAEIAKNENAEAEADKKAVEAAEAQEAADKKSESATHAKVEAQEHDHEEAIKSVEEEKKRGEKIKADLEAARARLERYRNGQGGSGVHSGASRAFGIVVLAVTLCFAGRQ